ncbi:hypothetical protein F511_23331 [Dorcoceras hygrometricum]|uniref:Uncharacterized protein n=1 Tax=Dorcoceras hygrometricum TaxID=472368 RepID=A0A2Z7AGN5_9LAMI|nr:hypothetical protein F511_23331 [Dorcoceras hygrometricum]
MLKSAQPNYNSSGTNSTERNWEPPTPPAQTNTSNIITSSNRHVKQEPTLTQLRVQAGTSSGITSRLPYLPAGIRHPACTTITDYTASTEQLLDSPDHATRQIKPATHSSAYHQPMSKLVSLNDVAPPPAQDNQLTRT